MQERKFKPAPHVRTPENRSLIPGMLVLATIFTCAIMYVRSGDEAPAGQAAANGAVVTPKAAEGAKDVPPPPPTARDAALVPPHVPNGFCITSTGKQVQDGKNGWCGKKRFVYTSIIVDEGRRFTKLPKRGWVVAVATAMQESGLLNQATNKYPLTKRYPYDKLGSDHDSVGLFQQRPSQGWGDPGKLMQPRYAAKRFYGKLADVTKKWPGWEKAPLTQVAQRVQISRYPNAYQKHEKAATAMVDYVLGFTAGGAKPAKASERTTVATAVDAAGRSVSGSVMVQCRKMNSPACRQETWQHVQPVLDNRQALAVHFPIAQYKGDLGDKSHMDAVPLQDHTPAGQSCLNGLCNVPGWTYAQDIGGGGRLQVAHFVRWLYGKLMAGFYKEVKYIICNDPANRAVNGKDYTGLRRRDTGWRQEGASGHGDYVHISYAPGFEWTHSTIIADYAKSLA